MVTLHFSPTDRRLCSTDSNRGPAVMRERFWSIAEPSVLHIIMQDRAHYLLAYVCACVCVCVCVSTSVLNAETIQEISSRRGKSGFRLARFCQALPAQCVKGEWRISPQVCGLTVYSGLAATRSLKHTVTF